jgi:hypothetical protein
MQQIPQRYVYCFSDDDVSQGNTELLKSTIYGQSFEVNCASVTPAPMADVEDTPPVTVLIKLSA